MKTQAARRGFQIRYENERVSQQERRARIVLTKAGHDIFLPWSRVCMGLKRAKQAAAMTAHYWLEVLQVEDEYEEDGFGATSTNSYKGIVTD